MNQIQSEQVNDIFAAISKMQSDLGHAQKDKINPHLKNGYATLESVIDASKEPLADHGLAVIQTMAKIDGDLVVVTTLAHSSGQWIRSFTPILSEKQTAQGMGSGITYARRYAYAAIVGLTQTDDDGNEASGTGEPNQSAAQAPKTQATKTFASVVGRSSKPNCEGCSKPMMVSTYSDPNFPDGYWYCVKCKIKLGMEKSA